MKYLKSVHIPRTVISILAWVLFGGGLALSGMTSASRVIGFLDFSTAWDPTLIFVMIGAVIVSFVGHTLLRPKAKPFFDALWNFSWEKRGKIDARLVGGSALFGIGWGLAGLCPGPAIGSIFLGNAFILVFLASMLITMYLAKLIISK